MEDFTFVTGNEHKWREAQRLLGRPLKREALELPEPQAARSSEVALAKARAAHQALGRPVIVEDTGLQFHALGGFPGPFIKFWEKQGGLRSMCRALDGLESRGATAACALAFADGQRLEVVEGLLEGTISREPRGEGGFGWDAIFCPGTSERTLAEHLPAEKDALSHRARAWALLKARLEAPPRGLHTEDFDFALPEELIAQHPLPVRDESRLLHLARQGGAVAHRRFLELPGLLRAGDLLVFNDSRVLPARLHGRKEGSGGQVELLLVRPEGEVTPAAALQRPPSAVAWTCLGQASKGLKVGQVLQFAAGLAARVLEARGEGAYLVRFESPAASLGQALHEAGKLPLPPYIDREPQAEDEARYQTVYAREEGSVAAPTAGLHFTERVFQALQARGVETAFLTLHVGPGTFQPVREGEVAAHRMHAEWYEVPDAAARAIEAARARGGQVVAVGTTVVRTLEAWAATGRRTGDTALFITPGFRFQLVEGLVTNFHLPRSTLVMLVASLLGRERTLAAYAEAVARQYRFFSYGDAMFIDGRGG